MPPEGWLPVCRGIRASQSRMVQLRVTQPLHHRREARRVGVSIECVPCGIYEKISKELQKTAATPVGPGGFHAVRVSTVNRQHQRLR